MTTKFFVWFKTLHYESQISTSLYDWGINWSLRKNLCQTEVSQSPIKITTMSEIKEEQLKLVLKVADVVNRLDRMICVTQLRYIAYKPKRLYVQVRFLAGKIKVDKLQQIVRVNFKLEEIFYLLDVMSSVYDSVIPNQPDRKVSKK